MGYEGLKTLQAHYLDSKWPIPVWLAVPVMKGEQDV